MDALHFRHPARGFRAEPGILWAPRTGPWMVLRVEPLHYDGLPEGDMIRHMLAFQSLIETVGHGTVRLFVTTDPWTMPDPATSDGRDVWREYEQATREWVADRGFTQRSCYVAISLLRTKVGVVTGLLADVWRWLGLARSESQGSTDEDAYRKAADVLMDALSQTGCVVTPAPVEAIARLVARPFWLDLDRDAQTVSGAYRSHVDEVEVIQPNQQRLWAAHLIVEDTRLSPFPQGAWLLPKHTLAFEPDVTIWSEVVTAEDEARVMERMHDVTADQIRNITGGSEHDADPRVSIGLGEQLDSTRALAHAIRQEGRPWTWWQCAVTVTAPNPDVLGRRVSATVKRYAQDGVILARPKYIQGQLHQQMQLGARRRVHSPRLTMKTPSVTLAAAMPHASIQLGMDQGPYLGHTTFMVQTPVFLDPLALASMNVATTMVITGQQGAGKSATAKKLAAEARMRGAWVLIMDPSNEYGALCDLPGMGRVNRVALGHRTPGVLDPPRVYQDPAAAARFAVELAMIMLAPGTLVETYLTAVAKQVMEQPGASMRAFVRALLAHSEPSVVAAGGALDAYAADPLASLFFGEHEGPSNPFDVADALTWLRWDGLDLADVSVDRGQWTAANRLSAAVLHGTVALVRKVMANDQRDFPKFWLMDEAHQFTVSPAGARLVTTGNTGGRKESLALGLITQNVAALGPVLNNVRVALCGRATTQDEQVAVCRALGRATQDDATGTWSGDPTIMARLADLADGEFMLRDPVGRVGRVQIDQPNDLVWKAADTTPKVLGTVDRTGRHARV